MTSVTAHFDGKVFVPDEPVDLEPGMSVIVTPTEVSNRGSKRPTAEDFLRPVLFPPDPETSQRFLDDPETNLENY
jgi:hypothetical protein